MCHVTVGAAVHFLMGIGTRTKADSYREMSFHARLGIAMHSVQLVKSAGGKICRLTLMDTYRTEMQTRTQKGVSPLQ